MPFMKRATDPLPARVTLILAVNTDFRKRVSQWVDAGEVLGPAPGSLDFVRSPVSGVVASITSAERSAISVVIERRREYEEMDH